MKATKRILMTLLTLVTFTGAWAIEQDTDGYYLIGSVQDWKDFAAIVNNGTNTAANAKMIADVDLGNDQTYIAPNWDGGFSEKHYHGTFDGQGHTLTVHYSSSNPWHTPFSQTSGATIKNLHVAGTLSSTTNEASHMSGLISNSAGDDVIQNVWVSADITSGGSGWIECGAFIGCNNCGHSTITDCLFTGSLKTTDGYYNGCFVGYVHSGSTSTSNCLSTGTFNLYSSPNFVEVGSVTNSYVQQHPGTIPSYMQLTESQLADGTIAYKLQSGRVDLVWGQRIGIDKEPVLTNDERYRVYKSKNGGYTNDPDEAYIGLKQDADGNYLISNSLDWIAFADMINSGEITSANAKMTADIDLGDDMTMIGDGYDSDASKRIAFRGTFDGQGHTLTINYVTAQMPTAQQFFGCAPFGYVIDGTIRNLHIAGTIVSSHEGVAGLIGYADGNTLIENCYSSVNFTFNTYDALGGAGFVYYTHNDASVLTIRDCIYDGTISGQRGYNAGFVVWYPRSTCKISNSLVTATISESYDCCTFIRPNTSNYTLTNCYYKTPLGTAQGIQATADDLSNGTTTAALNNNRTGDEALWVQDPNTNQPMLKIFVQGNGISTGIDSGQRSKGIGQRDGWYTIDGRKLSGKPTRKGIYINNSQKTVVQ